MSLDHEKGLEPALVEKLTRHAKRLIALAPDNPASHEIMSLVVLRRQNRAESIDVILEATR